MPETPVLPDLWELHGAELPGWLSWPEGVRVVPSENDNRERIGCAAGLAAVSLAALMLLVFCTVMLDVLLLLCFCVMASSTAGHQLNLSGRHYDEMSAGCCTLVSRFGQESGTWTATKDLQMVSLIKGVKFAAGWCGDSMLCCDHRYDFAAAGGLARSRVVKVLDQITDWESCYCRATLPVSVVAQSCLTPSAAPSTVHMCEPFCFLVLNAQMVPASTLPHRLCACVLGWSVQQQHLQQVSSQQANVVTTALPAAAITAFHTARLQRLFSFLLFCAVVVLAAEALEEWRSQAHSLTETREQAPQHWLVQCRVVLVSGLEGYMCH